MTWEELVEQGVMTAEEADAYKAQGHTPDTALNEYINSSLGTDVHRSITDEVSGSTVTAPNLAAQYGGGSGPAHTFGERRTPEPLRLPPGYESNLELIDWLKTQVPSAEDLQYDAPTYTEESLGLPSTSAAGQAFADPMARAAQYDTVERLQEELKNRGVGPEDILALTRISKQAEDTRLSGEQSRLRSLQSKGMTAGGAQLAGNLKHGRRISDAVQESRGDVLSEYAGRGQRAAKELGEYGTQFSGQVFGEEFERGTATDVLARKNAEALVRRGEDIRGMANRSEMQRAQSGLQSSAMGRVPAQGYLNFYQNESGIRGREADTAAAIEAENRRRANSGPGWTDWLKGAGTLVAGIATGNPGLIASGGSQTIGNIEGATNKPKKIKDSERYSYG